MLGFLECSVADEDLALLAPVSGLDCFSWKVNSECMGDSLPTSSIPPWLSIVKLDLGDGVDISPDPMSLPRPV